MPGDEIVSDAEVVIDREARLGAPPERVWPWLLQLGKERAGWYLPRSLERLIRPRHRSLRAIEPGFQAVSVGERVADYGPLGWFEARIVDPPHALVWFSERGRGLQLTCALVLGPSGEQGSDLAAGAG